MALHLSETIPSSFLAQWLPDDLLESVQSDTVASTYSYRCGCIAVRPADGDVCYMRWCRAHCAKEFRP